jgi:hypothetical protein
MLGLHDKDEMFLSWFDPRVSVLPEIPFCQGIEEVQMGIFLDANQLPAYLKGAVRVVRVNNGERDARITLEIAELLASLGETETDVISIPVEPDRSVVWLTFRPDGGDMCQGGRVQQISALLWNVEHQRVFPFVRTGEDLSSISSTGDLNSNLLTAEKKYLASLCIRWLARRSLYTRNRESWILCLQIAVVRYSIEGMFLKEDQDVALIADMIDFSDGRSKISHHLALGLQGQSWRCNNR